MERNAVPISRLILRVAVPSPLSQHFDYLPPPDLDSDKLKPGTRLRVPFGRAHKIGVLLEVSDRTDLPVTRLRAAQAVLDTQPIIPSDLLRLARWASAYYHHPIGEVLATLLPVILRRGKSLTVKGSTRWLATHKGANEDLIALGRAPVQIKLLELLKRHPEGVDAERFSEITQNWQRPIHALVAKGYVEKRLCSCVAQSTHPTRSASHILNPEQDSAVHAVLAKHHQFAVFLLDGVTGSGKTEVYLHIVDEMLKGGRQALVLVPEIGLTPQLIRRFHSRFGLPIALLHSGLTDRERLCSWLLASSGEAPIVLGTRSAVFTPLPQPGIIIVDEEHDISLKQQDGFRYHARDLAIVRAQRCQIPVVLGSATPSLETLNNAKRGGYRHLRLPQRAGAARSPSVALLDVRRRPMTEGLSDLLIKETREQLASGGQVMMFLNRRGYAPILICHDCGWTAECPRCDAHMTYHLAKRELRCHHCGAAREAIESCPACQCTNLSALGQGTERIEATLRNLFPDIDIVRVDRDTTRRRGAMQDKLEKVQRGEASILIGTQMLAKGHHFPAVTLVGILDADRGLYGADFRAPEQMAQLIIQVAGRAGRAERPGKVLIQTHSPHHPLLRLLVEQGYEAFAEAALIERQEAALPPYTRLALLRAQAAHPSLPIEFLEEIRQNLEQWALPGVLILGPATAPMERLAGSYRAQLLLQSQNRRDLHRLLHRLRLTLEALPQARKVRWSLDVDPMDML